VIGILLLAAFGVTLIAVGFSDRWKHRE